MEQYIALCLTQPQFKAREVTKYQLAVGGIHAHSSIAHIAAMRIDAMRIVEEAIVEAAQNIITVAATLSANAIGTAVTAVTLQGIDDGDIRAEIPRALFIHSFFWNLT